MRISDWSSDVCSSDLLLAEAADADGGILYDDPRAIALRYRVLRAMGDQPAVTIPYTDNLVIPFTPTDDDGLTRNREIGRASCRERVCQYVYIPVVAVSFTKHQKHTNYILSHFS